MTQNHRRNLEAFEMWIWRKMLKFSRAQSTSNQHVLDSIQEEKTLLDFVHQRKHILRHDGQLHTILEGRIELEEKRGRGRRRHQMIDDIMGRENYVIMKRIAKEGPDKMDHEETATERLCMSKICYIVNSIIYYKKRRRL